MQRVFFFCLSNGWRFVWWIVLSRLDFRCSLVSGLLRRRSAGSFSEQRLVIEPKCYPAFEITGRGPLRKNCWDLFLSRVEKMENLLFTNCHLVITKVNVLIQSFFFTRKFKLLWVESSSPAPWCWSQLHQFVIHCLSRGIKTPIWPKMTSLLDSSEFTCLTNLEG